MASNGAWVIWLCSMTAYVFAIANRTSFGVAGTFASQRFACSASVLPFFTVMQLLIYVSLQIPVGILLDKFGARVLLTIGSLLMGLGELCMSLAVSVPTALVGRTLVGGGDALTFISVMHLLPHWFAKKQVPLISQLSSLIGQFGQVICAFPFFAVLACQGWTFAFECLSLCSFGAALLVVILVRDHAKPIRGYQEFARPSIVGDQEVSLLAIWKRPGTRLGFWIHFTAQFPGTVFALLWGVPYLEASGVDASYASGTLALLTISSVIGGLLFGLFSTKYPQHELALVFFSIAACVFSWIPVLLAHGCPSRALVTLLSVCLGLAAPGSMVAFDYTRRHNPLSQQGRATGITNTGGFTASLVAMLLIGISLDLMDRFIPDGSLYSADHFKLAMISQVVVLLIGLVGIATAAYGLRIEQERMKSA